MWETSNKPAPERVARCSSEMDEYQMGNSNPWKSTMRPSKARCSAYNGVRTGVASLMAQA